MADLRTCDTCNTPLDVGGTCVTCRAVGQGLVPISRSSYASVREMLELLEEQDLAAEIEQVPARRPEEAARPLWNLYVPKDQLEQAQAFLRQDWAGLLEQPEAAAAAERGLAGVDLDAGGEITCPACGHRFVAKPGESDCPDCGLSLGAPSDSAPDESER